MKDKYGRNINYLRVSVTDRCNLRCIYCMPEEGILKREHDEILRNEDIIRIIKISAEFGIRKVRFTGGEPLVRKGIESIIYETSKIKEIDDIAMTTNGIMLYEMADTLKKAGLKRVNISLDTLKKDKFKKITRIGNIDNVFKAIEKSLRIGFEPVKINTVVIKGINDDEIFDFVKLADEYPLHVRFIEIMPIGEAEKFKDGYISSDELIKSIGGLTECKVGPNSTARVFKRKNAKGSIGFISPLTCKFCKNCNKIRLTALGTIKPCLHSKEEIDLKNFLKDEVKLRFFLKDAIFNKPLEHNLEKEISQSQKMMFQIGG
ncbi:cyclic pyranopterin monophosphate synthase subunit MoaA [Caloramator fervidus]|uniref:GTP 3',8-cyclase n=1 Tax=Caloramator fervidus TaxID=29344 RepID=A0A1H5WAN2_9CLOT|nr:GTP 3',8-cyclase MoaA [Caloramator fervidus]SEF96316.1 cyclic pyranopterin monophosphate synthase subunit MoaA [Caloramator fervidus]